MSLKFGTSGLRGLVVDMTPVAVARYTRAFLAACDSAKTLCVGRDLRPSSPRIAADVIAAAQQAGYSVVDCGALPTPALALAAQSRGAGAVMVTGSHIPADRNGLKFYTRTGEITKADETAILAVIGAPAADGAPGRVAEDPAAAARFVARYTDAFGPTALSGRRIGLYAHSAVGRDSLADILAGLGADVVEVGRAAHFIPVDTEAVDPETRAQIATWVEAHGLDALVSTDGDSDRPLLADETGRIVPGDILGQITAERLGAEVVVTPISSNSGVGMKGFSEVVRTRIGSPYVIAGMQAAQGRVAGYEANGGFLLGFEAQAPAGPIAPLMTRDCMLPLVVGLVAAQGGPVSSRVAQEPPVVTVADRLQEIPQDKSRPLMAALAEDATARAQVLSALGQSEAALDLTDGVRMITQSRAVVHIRPSGNAPELRVYVETQDSVSAKGLLQAALAYLRQRLGE